MTDGRIDETTDGRSEDRTDGTTDVSGLVTDDRTDVSGIVYAPVSDVVHVCIDMEVSVLVMKTGNPFLVSVTVAVTVSVTYSASSHSSSSPWWYSSPIEPSPTNAGPVG